MERAGIPVPGLEARDGLATINGSNVLTAMSALLCYDADRWLRQAEIAAAMTLEALLANLKPYNSKLHELRGFSGAVRSAAAIRACIQESDLATGKIKTKVQDAYSMRSTPQVIGAAHDALKWARSQVEIELNGVGDNPIFVPEEKLTLTGANFQGTPVSLPMEMVGQAITMVSVLSERRLNRLENPAMSQGLPDFLTPNPGFYSGLMLSQYTADMLIVEQRILSAPASTMSIPAAADQEDFVSMGMNTALKNRQILENAYGVLGIEFMAAAQALDFREFTPGKGVRAAKAVIRRHVDHLDIDRPLYPDHNAMAALVSTWIARCSRPRRHGRLGRDPARYSTPSRPRSARSAEARAHAGPPGESPAALRRRRRSDPRPAAFVHPEQSSTAPDLPSGPVDSLPSQGDRVGPGNWRGHGRPAVRAQLDAADVTVGPVHGDLPAPELIARSLARAAGRRDRLAPANGGAMDNPAVRAQLDAADITVGPLHRNLPAPELIARSPRAGRASSPPTARSS